MPTVPSIDVKPLYAIAGAGEAAVSSLRSRLATLPAQVKNVQTQVQQQVQLQVKAIPTLAQTLPTQAKDLREQVRKQAVELAAKAEKVYDEFVAQGEKTVARRRGAQPKAAGKPTSKPTAKKPAAKSTSKPAAKPAASVVTPSTPASSPVSAVPTTPAASTTGVASHVAQTTLEGTSQAH